ncbi:hypothetical protein [Bosea sp. MMO-172]|uniref:hypothetical protein n=1 Tax=Bosea sp. MMO-172 TaxID=3127885 RepID=UPI003016874C
MSDENDTPDVGTMDAIQAALAEEARGLADRRTFKPAYVWQVVAAALPEIDTIVEASKGRGKAGASTAIYNGIAAKLREASGFNELSGESVRQYRSRIKGGDYDDQLARIGFRRVDNRIVAIADLPKADHSPWNDARAESQLPANPVPSIVIANPPKPAATDFQSDMRLKSDPE